MPEIYKTRAVVLRKLDYGDTSKIADFYTEEFGKVSGIIKGARSKNSKIGMLIDLGNFVEIVFYKKTSREIQLVSQADLISHFPHIKDDLEKLKYTSAVLELLLNLTVEYETNKKLFKGAVRILELLNDSDQKPDLLFAKFFLFFIKEIGYELGLEICSDCGKKINPGLGAAFNFEQGILCSDCREGKIINFELKGELLNLLYCLSNKNDEMSFKSSQVKNIIYFLERFLIYHIPEFKGIKSFHIF